MNKKNKTMKRMKKSNIALRFSPTAWAKVLYFRDRGDTEIGGFGITDENDMLSVVDFITVKQQVTSVSVKFEDEAIADYFDAQVDSGRKPEQFARLWIHSHPGELCEPSETDEQTFERVFGQCQWSIMMIVSQDGSTYARLSFNVGPGGQMIIPVEVDYNMEFNGSDYKAWDAEYKANIKSVSWFGNNQKTEQETLLAANDIHDFALPVDVMEQFEMMSPAERQSVLDELSCRPELWDDGEVIYI